MAETQSERLTRDFASTTGDRVDRTLLNQPVERTDRIYTTQTTEPVTSAATTLTTTAATTTNKVTLGSSLGGQSVSYTLTNMDSKCIRVYEPNDDANTWGATSAAAVPANIPVSLTIKVDIVKLSNRSSAGYMAYRDKYRALLATAPTNQIIFLGINHEPWSNVPEGGGNDFTIAQWRNAQINFRNDVINYANLKRTTYNKIRFNANLEGERCTEPVGTPGHVDNFFTSQVCNALHGLSFDSYKDSQLPAIEKWIKSKTYAASKPWYLWEVGWNVNVNIPDEDDVVARMDAIQSRFDAMTKKPDICCWFISGFTHANRLWADGVGGINQEFSHAVSRPKWKNKCANSPARVFGTYM